MVLGSTGYSQVFIQWKNFIFMVLEPNCSIIAACLPCYGSLFKGTFKLENLVRPFRSVFSLASFRSQGSSARGTGYDKFGETESQRRGAPSETTSQIELTNGQKGEAFANAERISQASDEGTGMAGINVTKGVEVVRN